MLIGNIENYLIIWNQKVLKPVGLGFLEFSPDGVYRMLFITQVGFNIFHCYPLNCLHFGRISHCVGRMPYRAGVLIYRPNHGKGRHEQVLTVEPSPA